MQPAVATVRPACARARLRLRNRRPRHRQNSRRFCRHVRVRVQLIRHFEPCTTDIYLHNDCAHVGLIVHAPVAVGSDDCGASTGTGGGVLRRCTIGCTISGEDRRSPNITRAPLLSVRDGGGVGDRGEGDSTGRGRCAACVRSLAWSWCRAGGGASCCAARTAWSMKLTWLSCRY